MLASFVAVVLSIIIYFVNCHLDYLSVLIMVMFFYGLVFLQYKQTSKITFITSVISCAISYILFAFSAFLVVLLGSFPVYYLNVDVTSVDILSFTAAGVLQMIFANMPFLFRRFKKGMPYLQEGKISDTGIVICITLLVLTSLFTANPSNDMRFTIYLVAIVICGVLLIIWWLNRLTIRYREKIKSNEIRELKAQLQHFQEENTALKQNNEALSKIIHKDNKLIPTMEHSVQVLLQSLRFPDQESQAKVTELLQYLESVSEDRSGVLLNYEHQHQSLLQTGVFSIDSMIGYMEQKAYSDGVNLSLSLTASVKYLTDMIICEGDLSTLIADLLENALNSVQSLDLRYILLCIGIEDDHYSLDVFDSGTPFSEEVLSHLGLQRFTSHAETGGSGIGMMTTFEILKKCAASYVLDEVSVSEPYSKKISICFDGLNQFRVKSNRPELLNLPSVRPDVILI